MEFVFFENYGGDEVELFAQAGTHASYNTGFRLIGDTANGGLAISTLPDGSSGGGSVIATNLSASMLTSPNFRSSCYTRSTFNLANTAALNALASLNLRISYNDGFVAYLNGVKIAERNAPVTPAWNSPSTTSRDVTASLTPENINVTAFNSALIVGTNKLSVHGLNVAANDSSFLILPTLSGGALQAGGPFFFKQATPGTLNNTPTSLGFVADTTFSHKRGIYAAPFTLSITTATPGATLYTPSMDRNPPPPSAPSCCPPTPPRHRCSIFPSTDPGGPGGGFQNWIRLHQCRHQYLSVPRYGAGPADHAAGPGLAGYSRCDRRKYLRNGQEFDYGMDPDIVNSANPAIGGVGPGQGRARRRSPASASPCRCPA